MSVTRSKGRSAVALVVCAIAAVGTAACSSSGDESSGPRSSGSAQGPVAPGRAPAEAFAQGGAAAAGAPAQPAQPVQPVADTRSVIFTGTVKVTVRDVTAAAADATSIATAAGGFVGDDDRDGAGGAGQAQLVLRVPSAQFRSTVDRVSRLGRERTRQLSTQDVTDQVTDIDARIATGEAGVDRIRALIGRAQNMSDIVSLESELSKREADLESLKARQRSLADHTTLSTITAVFLPPAAKPAPAHRTGFLAGLSAGWRGFVTAMTVVVTVFGAALPWIVLLGVPALVVWWWRRRARRPAPTAG